MIALTAAHNQNDKFTINVLVGCVEHQAHIPALSSPGSTRVQIAASLVGAASKLDGFLAGKLPGRAVLVAARIEAARSCQL